jgi:hypothetical protein
MAKYTLVNDPNYILFNGIINTSTEGEAFAFRKTSVKQLRTYVETGTISFVHLDDTDSPFYYYDLIDPVTGHPFVSLSSARIIILSWLNGTGGIDNEFLGVWDASLNDPMLGNGGYWDATGIHIANVLAAAKSFFIVDVAGSTSIDGNNTWVVGDIIKTTGSQWVRIPEVNATTAINVVLDNTYLPQPEWALISNVQAGIEHIVSTAVHDLKDLTSIDPSLTPTDKQVLEFNSISGKWEAVTLAGGRTLINAIAILDGTNSILPAYGDGIYVLAIGTSAPWVPIGSVVGDVLTRVGAVFVITIPMVIQTPGSYEVQYQYSAAKANSITNYVWDGTEWSPYDAYEPATALLSINVSNPVGDITAGFTAADLKARSISSLLDDMLFKTIYVAPLVPTLTLTTGANQERGSNITGTSTVSFNQRGGGPVTTYSILGIYNSTVQATQAGAGPSIPNVNLGNINGYPMKTNPVTNQVSQVQYSTNYSNGSIPVDNKGNTHPADQILAGSLSVTSTWTARYPVWWDSATGSYGVAPGDLTDLSVPPTVIEANIRSLANTTLFTGNLTQQTSTIHAGDVTILVALPPGITMSTSELNVAGSWLDFSDLRTHSITVSVLAADSTTPKNYTVYYARSVAGSSFTITQDFRFTTTGTVTP